MYLTKSSSFLTKSSSSVLQCRSENVVDRTPLDKGHCCEVCDDVIRIWDIIQHHRSCHRMCTVCRNWFSSRRQGITAITHSMFHSTPRNRIMRPFGRCDFSAPHYRLMFAYAIICQHAKLDPQAGGVAFEIRKLRKIFHSRK